MKITYRVSITTCRIIGVSHSIIIILFTIGSVVIKTVTFRLSYTAFS